MASEELMQISRDEAERMRLLSEEKYILDNQSLRAEGIKIGRKESEAEIAQIRIETARTLKSAGVSLDIISQSTGLSLEEIAEL